MSLWKKLFGAGDSDPNHNPYANIGGGNEPDGNDLPYQLDERRMPEGEDLDILLPRQVGSFIREPIKPPSNKNMPIYANYRSGSAHVFMELGICKDSHGPKLALATAKREGDAEFPDIAQPVVERRGVQCLRTISPLGAFVAWTRGRYYFSAHTKSGEPELDEFMRAFPF